MTEYNSTIVYNSVSLNVTSIVPTRRQKTRKSTIGKILTQIKIIGLNAQQWELKMNGIILGDDAATLSTNRAAIEALDVVTPYAYTDGIHNGTYILDPGSLIIKDTSNDAGMKYAYSMTLVEE